MNLNKEINLNKKVIVFLLLVSIMGLTLYYSYALFEVNVIKENAIVIQTATNLDITTTIDNTNTDTFTLNGNETKTITVKLDTNGITSAMAYKMYYELTGNSNFTVTSTEVFNNNEIEGIMQPYDRGNNTKITGKVFNLTFQNNTSNNITIKLGAIGGFEKTGAHLNGQQKLLIGINETDSPTLSLEKETIKDQDLTTWNNNGTTISNGVMTIATSSQNITSNYIDVNGGFWYMTLDAYSEKADDNGYGKVYWSSTYYDNNYQKVNTLEGYSNNGWAVSFEINKWCNNLEWYTLSGHTKEEIPRYGPNAKYITIYFEYWNAKTIPIQIRNVKIHGETIPNSFYNINITSSDNVGVVTTKYAKGNQNKNYFKDNGTIVNDNQIRVTENGTYTVYVEDAAGNSTIQTIDITNII